MEDRFKDDSLRTSHDEAIRSGGDGGIGIFT